jgi:hypothetical protein
MTRAIFAAATLIILSGALARGQAPAVRIAFDEGRVTLAATDALVSEVLAEWTRVGGTVITGADHLPGTRVTVDFDAVSELVVLDELLGSAGGYVSGMRSEVPPGSSVLRMIQIGRRSKNPRPATTARVIDMTIPESRFDYGVAAADAPDPWDSIDEIPTPSAEPYVMPEMRYQYFEPADPEPQPQPEAQPEPESQPDPKTAPKTKKPPSGC